MKPRALLFDMDGLMFDTERLADKVWLEFAPHYGIPMEPEDMELLRGRNREGGKTELLRRFGADIPFDAIYEAAQKEFARRTENSVPVKPGLRELLKAAQERGLAMAVVSSTPRALVERHLKVTHLTPYYQALVCGDMVKCSKPAPDIFLLGARTLGFAPEECMVLEDSYNGVRAGHAAGSFTVMIPDLAPVTEEMRALADRILPSLRDVIGLLDDTQNRAPLASSL